MPLASLTEDEEVEIEQQEGSDEVFDLAAPHGAKDFNTEVYDLAAPKGTYFALRTGTAAKLNIRDKTSSSGSSWGINDLQNPSPSNSDQSSVSRAVSGLGAGNGSLEKQKKFVNVKHNRSYRSHRSNMTGGTGGSRYWGGSTWGASLHDLVSRAFGGGSGGSVTSLDEYMSPGKRDRRRVFNWFRREVGQDSSLNVYTRDEGPGMSTEVSRLLGSQRLATPRLILHPYSKRRITWECFSMLFLFYSMVVVPVKLCFNFDKEGCSRSFTEQRWHWYTDLAVDFAFILDVVVNLRTAYVEEDQAMTLVTSPWRIFTHYARGFLALDIISAMPVDLILISFCDSTSADTANTNNVLRAPTVVRRLQMLRLTRLLRLKRVRLFLERMRDTLQINPGFLRLIKFALLVMVFTHYNGCIFFFIGESAVDNSNPKLGTWTTSHQFFSDSLEKEVRVTDMAILEQYWISLYWSVTTMTTVGFGDITPQTTPEVFFCILIIIEGGAALGYVIGSLADMVSRLNKRRREYRDKMEYWDDVFFRGRFPQSLRAKIRRYHEWMFLNNISKLPGFAEQQLSKTLLRNVVSHIYRDHLRAVPFFRDFTDDALTHLALALEHVQVPPGEIIYKEGDVGSSMLFLQRGDVQFSVLLMPKPRKELLGHSLVQSTISSFAQHVRPFGLHHRELPNGEQAAFFCWHMNDRSCCVFGESVLFSADTRRLSTASSARGCIVLRLTAAALKHLSAKVPEMEAVVKKMEHTKVPLLKKFSRSIIQINRVLKCDVPRLQVTVHGAAELPRMDQFTGRCDPYCLLDVGAHWKQHRVRSQTLVVYNTYTPSWDETFSFHLSDYSPTKPVEVNFTIMDWDQVGEHDFVGEVTIDLRADVHECMESKQEVRVGPKWLNLKKDERHVRGHRKRISKIKVSFKIFPPVSTHKLEHKASHLDRDTLHALMTKPAAEFNASQLHAAGATTPGQPTPDPPLSLEEDAERNGCEYDSMLPGQVQTMAMRSLIDRGQRPPGLAVANIRSFPVPVHSEPVASARSAGETTRGVDPEVEPADSVHGDEIRDMSPSTSPSPAQAGGAVPQPLGQKGAQPAVYWAGAAVQPLGELAAEAAEAEWVASTGDAPHGEVQEARGAGGAERKGPRGTGGGGPAVAAVGSLRERVKVQLGRLREEGALLPHDELQASATEAWTALEAVLSAFEAETAQSQRHAKETARLLRNMGQEAQLGTLAHPPDVSQANKFASIQAASSGAGRPSRLSHLSEERSSQTGFARTGSDTSETDV